MSGHTIELSFAEATVEQLRAALSEASARARECDQRRMLHTWGLRAETLTAELARRARTKP